MPLLPFFLLRYDLFLLRKIVGEKCNGENKICVEIATEVWDPVGSLNIYFLQNISMPVKKFFLSNC